MFPVISDQFKNGLVILKTSPIEIGFYDSLDELLHDFSPNSYEYKFENNKLIGKLIDQDEIQLYSKKELDELGIDKPFEIRALTKVGKNTSLDSYTDYTFDDCLKFFMDEKISVCPKNIYG